VCEKREERGRIEKHEVGNTVSTVCRYGKKKEKTRRDTLPLENYKK